MKQKDKMQFANCVTLAAAYTVLFTTLIENLRLVLLPRLGLFLNFVEYCIVHSTTNKLN